MRTPFHSLIDAALAQRQQDQMDAISRENILGINRWEKPKKKGRKMADTTIEKKLCPSCGVQLRRDNSRGACSKCIEKGDAVPTNQSSDSMLLMRRFRSVAKALGHDPHQLIEQFAQRFLDRASDGAKTAGEPGNEA